MEGTCLLCHLVFWIIHEIPTDGWESTYCTVKGSRAGEGLTQNYLCWFNFLLWFFLFLWELTNRVGEVSQELAPCLWELWMWKWRPGLGIAKDHWSELKLCQISPPEGRSMKGTWVWKASWKESGSKSSRGFRLEIHYKFMTSIGWEL